MVTRKVVVLVAGLVLSGCVTGGSNESQIQVSHNLDEKSEIVSPSGKTILKTLQAFETAYESGKRPALERLLHDDFKKIRLLEKIVLKSESKGDYVSAAGKPLDISLSHLKRASSSDTILAVAAVGRNGKYFTDRSVDVFLFDRSDLGRIKGIISTPIYYENYPPSNVAIYFGDNFNTMLLEAVLSSNDVDKAMDGLLKSSLGRFAPRQDLFSLIIFRTPPKPGSTVKTEYFFQSSGRSTADYGFSRKLDEAAPYMVLTDYISTHGNAGSITVHVYIDGELVGRKSIDS